MQVGVVRSGLIDRKDGTLNCAVVTCLFPGMYVGVSGKTYKSGVSVSFSSLCHCSNLYSSKLGSVPSSLLDSQARPSSSPVSFLIIAKAEYLPNIARDCLIDGSVVGTFI